MALKLSNLIGKWSAQDNGCWVWNGSVNSSGYGRFSHRVSRSKTVGHNAHRAVYMAMVGPIPSDMQLDHLCRNKLCVNPDHMEVVTHRENTLRSSNPAAKNAVKEACKHGHPFDSNNTYIRPDRGTRSCKACQAIASQKYNLKLQEA